jgi:hypothetical protein
MIRATATAATSVAHFRDLNNGSKIAMTAMTPPIDSGTPTAHFQTSFGGSGEARTWSVSTSLATRKKLPATSQHFQNPERSCFSLSRARVSPPPGPPMLHSWTSPEEIGSLDRKRHEKDWDDFCDRAVVVTWSSTHVESVSRKGLFRQGRSAGRRDTLGRPCHTPARDRLRLADAVG